MLQLTLVIMLWTPSGFMKREVPIPDRVNCTVEAALAQSVIEENKLQGEALCVIRRLPV
jgi:hypothetical protein